MERSYTSAGDRVKRTGGRIALWHDRKIGASEEWAERISDHLETADLILLLVSADFLASDYCFETEMQRALERHREGTAKVVPILLRPCGGSRTVDGMSVQVDHFLLRLPRAR